MNRYVVAVVVGGLLVIGPTRVHAQPPKIDLSLERAEYEKLQFNRSTGLVFTAVAVAALGTTLYGYSSAVSARDGVYAQTAPYDIAERRALVDQAATGSTLGVVGALLTVGSGFLSYYFLSGSFQ